MPEILTKAAPRRPHRVGSAGTIAVASAAVAVGTAAATEGVAIATHAASGGVGEASGLTQRRVGRHLPTPERLVIGKFAVGAGASAQPRQQ